MSKITDRGIHEAFLISIVLKGALALFECVAGLALVFVSSNDILALVTRLTQAEIAEDPNDLVASHLIAWAQNFAPASKNFYAWYFLSHGVVKLLVVAGLLSEKLWAYPASIAVLVLFIAYQIYRYTYAPSLGLVILTIFDIAVIFLVLQEYRMIRRAREAGPK